jgi:hypothetical protein
MGTYQRRKMRMKRITQVKTNSPMKILFCGLISNVILSNIQISKSEADDSVGSDPKVF